MQNETKDLLEVLLEAQNDIVNKVDNLLVPEKKRKSY